MIESAPRIAPALHGEQDPARPTESFSDALLRQAFQAVPGAIEFATIESPAETQVFLVLEGDAEEQAIRAFLHVRRTLGDYSLRLLTIDPSEAEHLRLSENARIYPI